MEKYLFAFLTITIFSTCTPDAQHSPGNDSLPHSDTSLSDSNRDTIASIAPQPDTIRSCYQFNKGEQHNWMNLTRVADSAYGDLHYNWEGKDGANGNFEGNFRGDTLWLLFYSVIEGHHITFEESYLLKDDKILKAQGELQSNDEETYYRFKHRKSITYTMDEYMLKGPCR